MATGDPPHVVFIDDEVEILKAVQRQLTFHPEYRASFLSDPTQVYELIERDPVDIIVADVVMPEMDGITLLQDIKSKHPMIIRILLTAYRDYNTSLRAIKEAEVFGFITKPWEEAYLMGHLKMAVQLMTNLLDQRYSSQLPLFAIGQWSDDQEIGALYHTGQDELVVNHLCKRVFMLSAALFGDRYRFQNNRFTLPLQGSELVVRGSLVKEEGENFGVFVFDDEIDEDRREQLDLIIDRMEMVIHGDNIALDLESVYQEYQTKHANLSS